MRYQTPLLALLSALVVGACATPEALRGDAEDMMRARPAPPSFRFTIPIR